MNDSGSGSTLDKIDSDFYRVLASVGSHRIRDTIQEPTSSTKLESGSDPFLNPSKCTKLSP